MEEIFGPNFFTAGALSISKYDPTGKAKDSIDGKLKTYPQRKSERIGTFHVRDDRMTFYGTPDEKGRRKRLVPLFDQYNIDLVLESDGHCVKRTVPIKNNKQHPEGVVYLGEGGYGAPQRTPKKIWYLEAPGFSGKADHYMTLRVDGDTISYQTVGSDAKIIDQHKFKARQR